MKNQIHAKDKGSLGEIAVAKDLIRRGLPVFVEYGDNSVIDIITQRKKRLITLQVKAYQSSSGSIKVRTLRTGPNYRYRYELGDFDIFAVYSLEKDRIFYVPLELVVKAGGSINLRLRDLKTSRCHNVRYASDYLSFSKAVKYLDYSDNEKAFVYQLSDKLLRSKKRYESTRRFMTKEIALELQALRDRGLTNKEISSIMNVYPNTISRTIKKFL